MAIRIAGIGLNWQEPYARSYAAKLEEMGFHCRVLVTSQGAALIAYSHRSFSVSEMEKALQHLFDNHSDKL